MRESLILNCTIFLCILLSNPFVTAAEREYRYYTDNESDYSKRLSDSSNGKDLRFRYSWDEAEGWLDDVDVFNFSHESSRSEISSGNAKYQMIEQKFDVAKKYEWELENQDSWFTTEFNDFN